MTGAPVPAGADAIVMVEHTQALEEGGSTGGTVAVRRAATADDHIRRAGEDVRVGELVLRAGEVVNAASIGLMAAVGTPAPRVYRRPRVAIVSTGDELVEIDTVPGPGQIRNSNSYSLAAQVLAAGGVPHILGIARDNEADTRALLGRAPEFDLMVTTGGVSMGDFDVVKTVLQQMGELDFWKVAMRPGRTADVRDDRRDALLRTAGQPDLHDGRLRVVRSPRDPQDARASQTSIARAFWRPLPRTSARSPIATTSCAESSRASTAQRPERPSTRRGFPGTSPRRC